MVNLDAMRKVLLSLFLLGCGIGYYFSENILLIIDDDAEKSFSNNKVTDSEFVDVFYHSFSKPELEVEWHEYWKD